MAKMKKPNGRAGKIPFALLMGWVVGVLCTLLLAAAMAQLMLSETIPESNIGSGAMIILAISGAVDALVSAVLAKKRWLQVCIGAGGIYFVTLLGLGGTLFGGTFSGVGTGLIVTLGASAAIGLFALKGEKKTSVKRSFQRYG